MCSKSDCEKAFGATTCKQFNDIEMEKWTGKGVDGIAISDVFENFKF